MLIVTAMSLRIDPQQLTVRWVDTVAALPADAAKLCSEFNAKLRLDQFYSTLDWYELLCRVACPPDAKPGFLLIASAERSLALLALWRFADGSVSSLTSPYSCLYQPLFAPDLEDGDIRRIGAAVGRALRAAPFLRLECLDAESHALAAFCAGLRGAGLVPLRYEHFGNWHADISIDGYSGGWAFYLASRSGALRETIRRRGAKLARNPAFRRELIINGPALATAIAGFEAVYAKSWKTPEPIAAFNAEMMQLCATHGVLRLAVLWHDDQPVAAQYWLVIGGVAQVLKLAHDSAFDAYSPGTLLTAWTIESLLDQESVRALDFGRGDDPYKQLWVERRRQRIGVVAANPRQVLGLGIILRHVLGGLKRITLRK